MNDLRQFAPATQRNREPILTVLKEVLPATGTVLEISSGTGEHAVFFAPRLAPRLWIPSDPNPVARDSIAAWREQEPAESLYPPIALDVRESVWPIEQKPLPQDLQGLNLRQSPITAIVNINMIHISPWSACVGLMAGAERVLPPDGMLYLYGPFRQANQPTAPSNEAFDASLQMQNPEWGLRSLEEVMTLAHNHHLEFVKIVAMPANNLSVVFRRFSN